MSAKAIYAGSFDPLTNGHIDVVRQASDIFDEVTIVIAQNINKGPRHYPAAEMQFILQQILQRERLFNVGNLITNELTVNTCKKLNAKYLIRGIRSTSDFLDEENLARVNHMLAPDIRTVYFRAKNDALSSSAIRELLLYNQDVSQYVPPEILTVLTRNP